MTDSLRAQVLAAYDLPGDDPIYRALEVLHAVAEADREAGQARVLGQIDAAVDQLTASLPPELRAAGLRIAYDTEGITT